MIKPAPTQKQIAAALAAVTTEYQVAASDIFSHDKRTLVSDARMLLWFVLRIASDASMPALGRLTGHKHSSVHRAVHRAIPWMRLYPSLRRRYDRIVATFHEQLA